MIKGSSLFYALVVSLLIAIISSSFILFAYLTKIEFDNLSIQERVNLNADSGLNLLLAKQTIIGLGETKTLDLYNNDIDSFTLSLEWWGAYQLAIVKASFGNTFAKRCALTGFYPTKKYSLYLADHETPLSLCGNSIIKGPAYLPQKAVKRAYIEGQNFIGKELINGAILKSEKSIEAFNQDLIQNINNTFKNFSVNTTEQIVDLNDPLINDTLIRSFYDKTLLLSLNSSVILNENHYEGNIAIISTKEIIVSESMSLKDVMLFAPKIRIQKNFRGSFQAFARDSIIVEENVNLNYPSVLGLLRTKESPSIASIIIQKGTNIKGNIFASNNENYTRKEALGIVVDKNATINGQIYSQGFIDLKGTINGSLMCNKIMLRTPSSVYENHLLNAKIDLTSLSKYYVSTLLVDESPIKRIVKWLD